MVNIVNKKAFANYQILEKFVAGIELKGYEVKSLFEGKGSLDGSYVSKRKNELYLINFYIPPYQEKNVKDYNPLKERRLLLRKKEILYLINQLQKPGLTIIPLRVFNKNRLIKVEIALAKGLKKYEKREKIKKKEFERQKQRWIKQKFVV